MPLQIIRNDITKVKADAIVNTANPHPVIGRGTDSAVYKAAGEEELLAERKKIGEIRPGDVAVTPAFGLQAKYIIHTVGPSWNGGNCGERDILHACYRNSLEKAAALSCESVAFPLIATGVYGFPKDEALQIALDEINRSLLTYEMKVILVVFDRGSFVLSEKLASGIDAFLEEHEVDALADREYGQSIAEELRRERTMLGRRRQAGPLYDYGIRPDRVFGQGLQEVIPTEEITSEEILSDEAAGIDTAENPPAGAAGGSLEEFMNKEEDSFADRLFRLIDERGLSDSEVYTRAGVTRQVFSKIRRNPDYQPKKCTAYALSIALELDRSDMLDLLSRAGLTFSPTSKTDLIIDYFVTNHNYNVGQIDAALFHYDQPTLFSDE